MEIDRKPYLDSSNEWEKKARNMLVLSIVTRHKVKASSRSKVVPLIHLKIQRKYVYT